LPFVDDNLRNTDGSLKDEEAKNISIFVQLAPIPPSPAVLFNQILRHCSEITMPELYTWNVRINEDEHRLCFPV